MFFHFRREKEAERKQKEKYEQKIKEKMNCKLIKRYCLSEVITM